MGWARDWSPTPWAGAPKIAGPLLAHAGPRASAPPFVKVQQHPELNPILHQHPQKAGRMTPR